MLSKIKEEHRELVRAASFCEFNQTNLAKHLGISQTKISNVKTYILKESGIIGENGVVIDEEKLKEIRTDYLNKISNGLFEPIQYKNQTDYINSLKNTITDLEEENNKLRRMLVERASEEKGDIGCMLLPDFIEPKEIELKENEEESDIKKKLEKAEIKIESYRDSIRLLGGGAL